MSGNGGCVAVGFKCLLGFMALSFVSAELRSCGYITGDIKKDGEDVYKRVVKQVEKAKPYLNGPARDVQEAIGSDVPFVSEFSKGAIDVLTPQQTYQTDRTPVGSFKVDLLAVSGPNKQFSFDVVGRDSRGDVRIEVTEYGSKQSNLGDNLKFNVVFFEQGNDDKQGIRFSLSFHRQSGCVIGPYDSSLRSLVYVDEGNHFCIETNDNKRQKALRPVVFSTKRAVFSGCETLSRDLPQYVREDSVSVPARIQKQSAFNSAPIEILYTSASDKQGRGLPLSRGR